MDSMTSFGRAKCKRNVSGKVCTCQEWVPLEEDGSLCECCGDHMSFHEPLHPIGSGYGRCVKECDDARSSHVDGCQEFFSLYASTRSRKCAGCGCHRSYHEKVTVAAGELAGPSNVHFQQQEFLSDDGPSTSLPQSSSMRLKLDGAIIPIEADSEHERAAGFRRDLKNESDRVDLEPKHKVFLSHSGAQKDFVEQLCIDLERRDRYPFFDKRRRSLPVGMKFPKLLFAAIQQSEVGVVVLSEEFFSKTKWPMLELVEMVRSSKRLEASMIIVPVFLRITREECRKLESQERWIQRWREWAEIDKTIDIEEWKLALKIFGSTTSLSYKDSEVSLRKEVVDVVCELVIPESRWDDSNVEGKDRLCKVILDKVGLEVKDPKVRVMGLYGVGGIGKTTICKVLCNKLFKEFRGRVCHTELKPESKSAFQLELLHEVLKIVTDTRHEDLERMNIDKCKDQLNRCIVKQPIFLAIDNVDEDSAEQAKTYLKAKNLFRNGSVVVVTSRSLSQLRALNIHKDDCLGMPELELHEAMELFRNYAKSIGDVEYELDERIIARSLEMCRFSKGDGEGYHYHPLALTVLGNEVREQMACNIFDPTVWYSRFSRIEESYKVLETKKQIFLILRISYDTLLSDDKMLFMDVALFMRHLWSDDQSLNLYESLEMVHGLGKHEELKARLKKLEKKSLLEKVGDGSTDVVMHDLWREFCVAETKVGEFPERRWVYFGKGCDELEERTPSGSCWENLERMYFMSAAGVQKFLGLHLDHFSNVKVLRVAHALIARDPMVVGLGKMIHLKYLEIEHHWSLRRNFPLEYPTTEVKVHGLQSLTNLAILQWMGMPKEVGYAEDIGRLTNLQVFKLLFCKGNTLLDMSNLTSLRMASFNGSHEVHTIRGLTGKLSNLQYLNLEGCTKLRSCPGVGDLFGLKVLVISMCPKLKELPNLGKLTNLTVLNMSKCLFLRVCPGLCGLRNLLRMDISWCGSLSTLPSLSGLVSLEELDAHYCIKLAKFPDMCNLRKLQVLNIWKCPVKTLRGLEGLITLRDLRVSFTLLKVQPTLQNFTSLQHLKIEGWDGQGLMSIAKHVMLDSLNVRNLHDCKRLTELVPLLALEKLDLTLCTSLTTLYLGNVPNLKKLNLTRCKSLTGITSDKPLAALRRVNLRRCGNIMALPDLGYFPGLKSLRLHYCKSLVRITSEGTLPALQILKLWSCNGLVALPDLRYFPDLRSLCLHDCKSMTSLNTSVPLLALHNLDLGGCVCLEQLADLSNFPSLRRIDLEVCESLLSLTSSEPLLALRSMKAKRCRGLKALPDHLCSSVKLKYIDIRGSGIELSEDTILKLLASCVNLKSVDTSVCILGEDHKQDELDDDSIDDKFDDDRDEFDHDSIDDELVDYWRCIEAGYEADSSDSGDDSLHSVSSYSGDDSLHSISSDSGDDSLHSVSSYSGDDSLHSISSDSGDDSLNSVYSDSGDVSLDSRDDSTDYSDSLVKDGSSTD